MRFNFRKISAIAASALMAGMTCGFAAAANYPAPFVSGGTANVAVVYGTGAGVSSLDLVQAGNIQDSLGTFVTGGKVTVEGGESFKLEKSSDKFNFGNALNSTHADLTDSNMEFLADGTYDDGNIDTTFTQKITLSSKTLSLFADSDYNDKTPTVGFRWTNGQNILDYDAEYDDTIPFTDLTETDMPIMGNTYYVLSTTDTSITLLDSADKVVLSEGDSVTVAGKTVSIEYIEDGYVKFNVDGEVTNKLADHGYEKLNDGSYIVANEVMYASKEAGISKVEFSIGEGKITLKKGEKVELNDEDTDGLVVDWTTNGTAGFIDAINFAWNSDGETYLTETDAITMPIFGNVKLVFGGLNFPENPETVSLENGETMTLAMGNYDLPLFNIAGTAGDKSTLGDEDYALVTKASTIAAVNETGNIKVYSDGSVNTSVATGGLDLQEDNRFLVTKLDTDLGDVDTLYYEVKTIDWDGTDVLIELQDLVGDKDISFDKLTDTQDIGDVTVSLVGVNETHAYLKFAGANSFNTAVSDKGLEVILPENTSTQTSDLSSDAGVPITFIEANKDGDLGSGMWFTAHVKANTNTKLHVSETNVTTLEDPSDVYWGYVNSDLTSKVTLDETADEYDFTVDYYGAEVTADVMVVGGAATISGGSNTLGNVLVKDTEVSSVATKNLIVVGGSCINSAAATLVGGTKCGAAWTAATGIGTGQFLIKGYADSSITTGLALLVAGYDAEDTVKATTYLTNKVVDTSKAYKGTTTTETAVVIS
jgi:hypothetical protein